MLFSEIKTFRISLFCRAMKKKIKSKMWVSAENNPATEKGCYIESIFNPVDWQDESFNQQLLIYSRTKMPRGKYYRKAYTLVILFTILPVVFLAVFFYFQYCIVSFSVVFDRFTNYLDIWSVIGQIRNQLC